MCYLTRQTTRKRLPAVGLMYVLVVLAGVNTAWWVGRQIGMDLSSITSLVSILGITETGRLSHGAVGYNASAPAVEAAPYCSRSGARLRWVERQEVTPGRHHGRPLGASTPASEAWRPRSSKPRPVWRHVLSFRAPVVRDGVASLGDGCQRLRAWEGRVRPRAWARSAANCPAHEALDEQQSRPDYEFQFRLRGGSGRSMVCID